MPVTVSAVNGATQFDAERGLCPRAAQRAMYLRTIEGPLLVGGWKRTKASPDLPVELAATEPGGPGRCDSATTAPTLGAIPTPIKATQRVTANPACSRSRGRRRDRRGIGIALLPCIAAPSGHADATLFFGSLPPTVKPILEAR